MARGDNPSIKNARFLAEAVVATAMHAPARPPARIQIFLSQH